MFEFESAEAPGESIPGFLMTEIRELANILAEPWVLNGAHQVSVSEELMQGFLRQLALVQDISSYLLSDDEGDEYPAWFYAYTAIMQEIQEQLAGKMAELGHVNVSAELLRYMEMHYVESDDSRSLYSVWVEAAVRVHNACFRLPPRVIAQVPDFDELPDDIASLMADARDELEQDWVSVDARGLVRIKEHTIRTIRAKLQHIWNLRDTIEGEDQFVFDVCFGCLRDAYTENRNELSSLNVSPELLWTMLFSGGEALPSVAAAHSIQAWKAQGRPPVVMIGPDEE